MSKVEIILAALASTEMVDYLSVNDTLLSRPVNTFTGEDREKLKRELLKTIIGIQV